MTKLVLDSKRSRVRIRTFAQGLLARLAHDLELACPDVVGSGERNDDDSGHATLEVPIAKIEVAGTLRGDRVDAGGLSADDRTDCLRKMRREVFHSSQADDVVRVEATLESGRARVRVTVPNGRSIERTAETKVRPDAEDVHVTGRVVLSLAALGSEPVKGPMNAFRVKDDVEVLFDVVFGAAR